MVDVLVVSTPFSVRYMVAPEPEPTPGEDVLVTVQDFNVRYEPALIPEPPEPAPDEWDWNKLLVPGLIIGAAILLWPAQKKGK